MSAKPLISVIDDDRSLGTALVGLLRSLGYQARSFGSAEEFLAAAKAGNFACIISDIHMPGMSGIELKRHLDAHDCPVPMILITGRADPRIEESVAA